MSNYDEALGNTIYNTTAENIDVKEGTTGGVVDENHFDGSGSTAAYTWIDVKGNDYTVDDNVGIHGGLEKTPDGVATFVLAAGYGNDNVFNGNNWNFAPATGQYGFFIDGGNGNVVGCDNTVVGARSFANVTCVP